jgi:hypothetical protein
MFLSDSETFAAWTLEDVVVGIEEETEADWVGAFRERYLDFDKVGVEDEL